MPRRVDAARASRPATPRHRSGRPGSAHPGRVRPAVTRPAFNRTAFNRVGRLGLLLAVTLPLMVACPEISSPGTGPRAKSGNTAAPGAHGSTSPKATGSPGPSASGSPIPTGSGSPTTSGGLDQNTSKVPTPTPLVDATSVPTEIPKVMGDPDGAGIVYAGAPAHIFFAAGGRGYVAISGVDLLGEFPSVAPGGSPFTYPAGVTGLVAAGPDGSGGAWVAGATSRTLLRLTGGSLKAETPIVLAFTPARLAADSGRAWVAGTGGEGLAVTAGATASFTFAQTPAVLAPDGSGGLWAAGSSPAGDIRLYSAPGSAPAAAANLGGEIAALATGDFGGVWAALKGSTPRLLHHRASGADQSVDLVAGETPHGVAGGGTSKAWVVTDKALYQIETLPSEALRATRYPRTQTWLPGGLATDPTDRRKVFATDPAGKAVYRLFTGS